ncbi:MAG: spinster family MFS transporter [Isosphaeraceae bacterium]
MRNHETNERSGAPDPPEDGGRPAVPTPTTPVVEPWSRPALATFVVLFGAHLLDQVGHWVVPSVLPTMAKGLNLDVERASWLSVWSLIGFTTACPALAYLGDRSNRRLLLATGVALACLATIGGGFAQSYEHLRMLRATFGVGAAISSVVAATLLMDQVPRRGRSRVFALYSLAIPLGGALGLVLGSWIAQRFGWRAAFVAVGSPGLALAIASLFLPNPTRGWSEGVDLDRLKAHERLGASQEDYVDLMVNSSYTYSVLGMAFLTFAVGGLAYWLPPFLTRIKEFDQTQVTTTLGLVTFAAVTLGMLAGGWLADALASSKPRALFLVPGLAILGSIPFVLLAIYSPNPRWVLGGIFVASALTFAHVGPFHAIIANVTMPNMRAAAFGVAFAAVHLLGDLWSPTLMGWVADTFGRRDAMATPFGQALAAMGALPRTREGFPPENLTAGLLVVIPALILAGGVPLAAARHLPREMALMIAKLKAAPKRAVTKR